MGAAFDDALIHAVATVVSTEARAFNNANRSGLDYWTPNINPYKDPRWGRGQETPGEDPFHIKSYVSALIQGLQGGIEPETLKVVATCKHFVGYDLEDWHGVLRYEFDAQISSQDLSEYYMQPFQTCARDVKVNSIMCSYNALNGVPTCADPYILQDVLRDHWNWTAPGHYVTTDCDSLESAYGYQHYADTREQVVADAIKAGTDLNCGTYYQNFLPSAFSEGLFNQSKIDQAVIRLYSALIRLGYFDPASSSEYRSLGFSDVATPNSSALALQAAQEGIVLLKNDGLLPLSLPSGQNTSVALIGTWANATTLMQGNYAGVAPYLNGPLTVAQKTPGINVIYGGSGGDPTTDGWTQALRAAQQADIVVFAGGTTESVASEGNDRNTINWTGADVDLAELVSSQGKPTIVLSMGDQLDATPFLNNPNINAIVWGGYPGQDGGTAIWNVILGKAAPAGRLPVTNYPANYVNEIEMTDMALRPNDTTGSPGRTYLWYNNATLPFGYGLHYTNFTTTFADSNSSQSFDISDIVNSCDNGTYPYLDLCPFTTVNVSVENTGSVSSDFVTLMFISGEYGPQPYPLKQLVAYERLFNVTGGASQTANLPLTLGSLKRHDEQGNAIVYPGEYSLLVDVPTQATFNFTLTGQQTTIDQWPQPR